MRTGQRVIPYRITLCLPIRTEIKQERGVWFVFRSSYRSEISWALICLWVGGVQWVYLLDLVFVVFDGFWGFCLSVFVGLGLVGCFFFSSFAY